MFKRPTATTATRLISARCADHWHEDPDSHSDEHDPRCPGPPGVVCACQCHLRSSIWLLEAHGAVHYLRRNRDQRGRAVAWCDPGIRGTNLVGTGRQLTCPSCDARGYAHDQVMA